MNRARRSMLSAALGYAARAIPVFPCVPRGKTPATVRGFYDASIDPEAIRRWWSNSDCNIGIPTGAVSGMWVLDIDPGGDAHLARLQADNGPLPATRTTITGRGGRHVWFRRVGPLPTTAGRVAPGIDTRGDGGYVVVPPSIHANGRAYRWSVDGVDELAAAPDWLTALARKKPEPPISMQARAMVRHPPGRTDAYGQAALDREIAALAATAPGSRNFALNRASFRLFRLVAGGELDGRDVGDALIAACHHNGLIKDDGLLSVVRTIRSGSRAGLKYPRSRSGAA